MIELDHRGVDTWLARLLLQEGRLDAPTLQAALATARTQRPAGHTLAQILVAGGVLSAEEVARSLQCLCGETQAHPPPGPPPAWEPGARIGPYQLRSKLGAGGMGVVFLAEHEQSGARYALKTLPANVDTELVFRFQREGEAQARVDTHPNVVKVHSAGVSNGRLYLVLDLVSGGDLAQRLERDGPLPPDEAARIARDVARGLAHAHARGVLHRDLKPANLLFDERGTPRLVDFGLAAIEGAERLTETGVVLGSPCYMAPEQATGSPVDARTDVYGLGALLYEAICGRAPFSGGSVLEVLLKVDGQPPTPLSELRPEVPPALEAICMRCLAKRPAARFASAEALAEALDGYLLGERPPPRGRVGLVLSAVLGLTVLALTVVSLSKSGAQNAEGLLPEQAAEERDPARADPSAVLQLGGLAGFEACGAFLKQDPESAFAPRVAAHRRKLIREPLLRLELPDLSDAVFTSDGQRIVARAGNFEDRSWLKVFTRSGLLLQETHTPYTRDMAIDLTSDYVALCGDSGHVYVYDLQHGTHVKTISLPGTSLLELDLRADGRLLVAGGRGALVALDWPSFEPVAIYSGALADRIVNGLAFDPHGTLYVLSIEPQGDFLEIYPDLQGAPKRVQLAMGPSKLVASPVRDMIGVGHHSGGLKVFDASGAVVSEFTAPPGSGGYFAHPDKIFGMDFGPRGDVLYTSGASPVRSNNDVRRWEIQASDSGRRARPSPGDLYRSVSVSPDGSMLLLTLEGRAELWAVDGLWAP